VTSHVLLSNEDFRIVKYRNVDDICPVIEEETGQKIDFPVAQMMKEDSMSVITTMDLIDYEKRKLKKMDRMELLADVFSREDLLEGFCLAFDESDETISKFCEEAGCASDYEKLSRDPVYQKRKAYMRMVTEYTKAAVNYYGVLHLAELNRLIGFYEGNQKDYKGFSRTSGSYDNTIIFNPRYRGVCTLRSLIGNNVPSVALTMDGLIVHKCFFEELRNEQKEWMEKLASQKRAGRQPDLDAVLGSLSYYSYRKIYQLAQEKPMYRPGRTEFLSFAGKDYDEVSLMEAKKRWTNHGSLAETANGKPKTGERKVYPNAPCPCGSGKKYKKCCGRK